MSVTQKPTGVFCSALLQTTVMTLGKLLNLLARLSPFQWVRHLPGRVK